MDVKRERAISKLKWHETLQFVLNDRMGKAYNSRYPNHIEFTKNSKIFAASVTHTIYGMDMIGQEKITGEKISYYYLIMVEYRVFIRLVVNFS